MLYINPGCQEPRTCPPEGLQTSLALLRRPDPEPSHEGPQRPPERPPVPLMAPPPHGPWDGRGHRGLRTPPVTRSSSPGTRYLHSGGSSSGTSVPGPDVRRGTSPEGGDDEFNPGTGVPSSRPPPGMASPAQVAPPRRTRRNISNRSPGSRGGLRAVGSEATSAWLMGPGGNAGGLTHVFAGSLSSLGLRAGSWGGGYRYRERGGFSPWALPLARECRGTIPPRAPRRPCVPGEPGARPVLLPGAQADGYPPGDGDSMTIPDGGVVPGHRDASRTTRKHSPSSRSAGRGPSLCGRTGSLAVRDAAAPGRAGATSRRRGRPGAALQMGPIPVYRASWFGMFVLQRSPCGAVRPVWGRRSRGVPGRGPARCRARPPGYGGVPSREGAEHPGVGVLEGRGQLDG